MHSIAKSKELEEVRFISFNLEVYSVALTGTRLVSRARGVVAVRDSTNPSLVPPGPGQVDRATLYVQGTDSSTSAAISSPAGHLFSGL